MIEISNCMFWILIVLSAITIYKLWVKLLDWIFNKIDFNKKIKEIVNYRIGNIDSTLTRIENTIHDNEIRRLQHIAEYSKKKK